jgi:hypothetical protein
VPRIRPTEHKAVVKLLDSPAESVEELATDVIMAIDELRAKRQDYVVVAELGPSFVMVFGPYTTRNAAEKDVGKNIIASKPGCRYMVLPLSTEIDEGIAP